MAHLFGGLRFGARFFASGPRGWAFGRCRVSWGLWVLIRQYLVEVVYIPQPWVLNP